MLHFGACVGGAYTHGAGSATAEPINTEKFHECSGLPGEQGNPSACGSLLCGTYLIVT